MRDLEPCIKPNNETTSLSLWKHNFRVFFTMVITQQKAFDIIMFSAAMLKSHALSILKNGIHKAESEIQLYPTFSGGKIKSVEWNSKHRVSGT